MPRPPDLFEAGTVLADRYELVECLGRGGMGVVYRARDRQRDVEVALKILGGADPTSIVRLKQEFRVLAGIAHRNLVQYHELVSAGSRWFFTMELVRGHSLTVFVRGEPDEPPGRSTQLSPTGGGTTVPATPPGGAASGGDDDGGSLPDAAGVERLRAAALELAEGLAALHAAGRVHRDVKPGNVLVEEGGRVVLLDLGIAREEGRRPAGDVSTDVIAGTPAYMAPEQASSTRPGPEADWYAFGVLLFEALTGRKPWTGTPTRVLLEKDASDGPCPSSLVADVPPDLDDLCRDLMRRDPAARPSGAEVLARLRAGEDRSRATRTVVADPVRASFVGRSEELRVLERALAEAGRGRSLALYLHGPSGMGKSTLLEEFLARLRPEQVLVLAGRCYEREFVPYKAIDGIVDALARRLLAMPDAQVEELVPPEAEALLRVFPVLGRVPALARPEPARAVPDLRELRRRAFTALEGLIERVAAGRTVLLVIDDLHWGDVDSAMLLRTLLRDRAGRSMLLLGAYRSEEAERSPALLSLRRDEPAARVRDLELAPLSAADAVELVRVSGLGGAGDGVDGGEDTRRIVAESGGMPLLVRELADFVHRSGRGVDELEGALTLERALTSRIEALPPASARLLEVLAVASVPLAEDVALAAADVPAGDLAASARLIADHLVRTISVDDRNRLEPFHDRVRQVVLARPLATPLVAHHRRLVDTLTAEPDADPEAVAAHLVGAGEPVRAARWAAEAAERAWRTLAFEQAARLYQVAVELAPDRTAVPELRIRLADSLANAGHGVQAADAYLQVASLGGAERGALFTRRAAEELLRSGHYHRGLPLVESALRDAGLEVAPSTGRALLRWIRHRLELRLRGYDTRLRSEEQVSGADLARIDLTWSVAGSLAIVAPLRVADLETLHLRYALDAGEPRRVARALAFEAGYRTVIAGRRTPVAARFLERAAEVASREEHPYATAVVGLMGGVGDFHEGEWARAVERLDSSESAFRAHGTRVAWERYTASWFALGAIEWTGRFRELGERVTPLRREAEDRQDAYGSGLGRYYGALVELAGGDVEAPRRSIEEISKLWPIGRFGVARLFASWRLALVELYAGDPERALEHVGRGWDAALQTLVLRNRFARVTTLDLRARAHLALAVTRGDRGALARARRDARRIAAAGLPWHRALGELHEAGIAIARGDGAAAALLLRSSTGTFEQHGLEMHAAVTRRALGVLEGGEGGRAYVGRCDDWLRAQGIAEPARWSALFVPPSAALAGARRTARASR